MRILVTGATGGIGRVLCRRLAEEGHSLVTLSRNPVRARAQLQLEAEYEAWDAEAGSPRTEVFRDVEAVIHLAGEGIADRRWSAERKRILRDSRVLGTRRLVQGLLASGVRPDVFVSGSATGIYGDRAEEALDENSIIGPEGDFLVSLCRDWEAATSPLEGEGIRVVRARTGIVLDRHGGALAKMLAVFNLGLGGRLGSGRQMMSWIHQDDLVNALIFALKSRNLRGAMNGTAPSPVSNADFTRLLARALHRPAILPIPAFALRLAAGEISQLLLEGQRVLPRALLDAGFRFQHPDLESALTDLFG